MTRNQPMAAEIASAVALASRAPSVHNTQPWQWRVTRTSLELYADPARRLPATDPYARLLLMSCGATLHHLCVVMSARRWSSHVARFPDRTKPHLLASVTFRAAEPDRAMSVLAEAVSLRRSDRRPMSSWEVPEAHIDRLVELAAEHGSIAQPLTEDQAAFWEGLARRAHEDRVSRPGYRQELDLWTHRGERSRDGIPASSLAPPLTEESAPDVADSPMARFPRTSGESRPLSLLLTTSSDDRLARLRAGEALSAVLLAATSLGLATSIESQVIEAEPTRSLIEDDLLQGSRSPQILVTVGWPSSADPLPETPRRPNAEIVRST